MTRETDAIIIGAGIIGAGLAFELAKKGFRTLNVDKLPAAGYGPTGSSCAIVRTHYSSREGVAMAHEASFYWQDWARYLETTDEAGTATYVKCGLVLLKGGTGHHKKSVRHYETLGVEFEDWDRKTLKDRMPSLDTHAFYPPKRPDQPGFWDDPEAELEGAVFTPSAGYVVDPQLATHNLQRAAEARGAEFLFNAEVTAIQRDRERVTGVTLAGGTEIRAPIVVNVAGPHSFVLNRMAGVEDAMRIKTRALRHEVHHVPGPPDFDYGAQGPIVSDGDLGIYFRPDNDNHILVGSEDPVADERHWIDDPNEYNRHVTEFQWETQVYRLARRMPSVLIPNERKGIVDLYDVADDWIPIYDRSDLNGFYMAVGTSGNQFKNAPIAARLMADLVARVEAGHDHDNDPLRLTCDYTGVVLDVGFYSRRRAINRDSSFSVSG